MKDSSHDREPHDSSPPSFGRRVLGGITWLSSSALLARTLSLFSAPILTRLLAPSDFGVASLLSTVVSIAVTIGLLGLDMSYARYAQKGSPLDPSAVEVYCWRVVLLTTAAGSVMAALFWAGGQTIEDVPRGLALWIPPIAVLQAVGIMAQIRARLAGDYRGIAMAILLSATVSTASGVLLTLAWRRDAWSLIAASALAAAAPLALLPVLPLRRLLRGSPLPWTQQRRLVSLGLSGITTAAMYWVVSSADRWFLGVYGGAEQVGIYSFAGSFATVGLVVNNALTASWFPEVTRLTGDLTEEARSTLGRQWTRLVVMLVITWLAVSTAGGDAIRLLAHPRFHEASSYVAWLAAGTGFYGLASLANTGLWVAGNMKPAAAWWTGAAVMNLLLNAQLVPRFGIAGAASASAASMAAVAGGVLWSSNMAFQFPIAWTRLLPAVGLAIAAALPMSQEWHHSPTLSLVLKLPAGLAAAALVSFVAEPSFPQVIVVEAFRTFRNFFRSGHGSN